MIPADEHAIDIDAAGPCGRRATLRCHTCKDDGAKARFVAATVALGVRAHRQHVAATDLAQNGRTAC